MKQTQSCIFRSADVKKISKGHLLETFLLWVAWWHLALHQCIPACEMGFPTILLPARLHSSEIPNCGRELKNGMDCGTSSPINGGGPTPPIKRMMQLDPAQYALLRQTCTSPSGGLVCVILDHSLFQSTDCNKLGFVVKTQTNDDDNRGFKYTFKYNKI